MSSGQLKVDKQGGGLPEGGEEGHVGFHCHPGKDDPAQTVALRERFCHQHHRTVWQRPPGVHIACTRRSVSACLTLAGVVILPTRDAASEAALGPKNSVEFWNESFQYPSHSGERRTVKSLDNSDVKVQMDPPPPTIGF